MPQGVVFAANGVHWRGLPAGRRGKSVAFISPMAQHYGG